MLIFESRLVSCAIKSVLLSEVQKSFPTFDYIHARQIATLHFFSGKYSRLSLSRSRRDPLKYFEISVLRHIRCAELRKIPIEQPNFINEHVI